MNEIVLIRGIVLLELICAYRHLHMLQLNSYNIDSHFIWLKKNIKSWISNFILLGLGVIRLFAYGFLFDIVLVIVLFTLLIENLPRKAKKKFVITKRIIRLMITTFILFFLTYIPYILNYNRFEIANSINIFSVDVFSLKSICFFIILIGVCLTPLIIYFANIINTPIEKILRLRFINEAKSMLDGNKDLIVIGVTGSFGKTSIKNYLHHMLSLQYDTLKTPDSFNTPLGVTKTIRESLTAVHKFFITEMGARRPHDIEEICDIVNPNFCIISNIGPQHLETFKTIDNITKTKFELVDSVLKNNGNIFVCGDNEYIKLKLKEGKYKNNKSIFTYGIEPYNDYYAKNIEIDNGVFKWTFVDNKNNMSINFETSLLGKHNIQNLVGVISICVNNNWLNENQLIERVKSIKPVPHRLEMTKFGNDILIDDAYNSNPEGFKAALNVLNGFNGYEKIIITPGMVELGDLEKEENEKAGLLASNICNMILLVGKKQAETIQKGIKQNQNLHEVKIFEKVQDAIQYAKTYKSSIPKAILIENDLTDNYL